jgi:hypothetical protein
MTRASAEVSRPPERRTSGALATLVVLVSTAAHAQTTFYEYLPFKNLSDSNNKFQYWVDDRVAMPAGLSVQNVKTAADNAWGHWNLMCAVPKSQSMGFTTGNVPEPSNPYDAFNVTPVFVTSNADPYYANAFGYDLSAVTLPLQYAGVLEQCDIYLNGVTRAWSTTSQPAISAMDVETVLLHEVGHCLGIDHNPYYPDSVMVASVLPGVVKRMLTADDADMLCKRYPAAGGVGSLCPNGDADCGTGGLKCVTQPVGTGTVKYCTMGCPTGQNFQCDVPLTCQLSTTFSPSFDGACLRPAANVTQVGKPCTQATDCESSTGSCRLPMLEGTGTTLWIDGYCTQSCAAGQPPCPAASACVSVDLPEGAFDMCLQSCRVGFADCRPGYACAATPTGGVCAPRCENNADCAAGFACRTCDGLCVQVNSQTQPGDLCTSDETCGFGQTCIPLDRTSGLRICSSGCGSGCALCPAGSTCQPIPLLGGQFFCLRNCVSGSCPTPLQCANLPTGRGCVPPCSNDLDCPVGIHCNNGECSNPAIDPDGGCGLLCQTEDSGYMKPPPGDAGTGGGGNNGGCGCKTSPPSLLFALMGLFLLRSRPWRRQQ